MFSLLWFSILISKSLPKVTLVRIAVMARVSPKTYDIGSVSELVDDIDVAECSSVAEIRTIGCYLGMFRASMLDK